MAATDKRRFFRVYVEDFLHDAPDELKALVLENLKSGEIDETLPTLLTVGPNLPCIPPFTVFEPQKKILPTSSKKRTEYINARNDANEEQSAESEGQ